jgi:hypothetical protein
LGEQTAVDDIELFSVSFVPKQKQPARSGRLLRKVSRQGGRRCKWEDRYFALRTSVSFGLRSTWE